MNKSTELKIIAGTVVKESKLSKAAKLQMFNFIQNEASDAQIKALLLDGKIVKLDEMAEQIVNDRFDLNEGALKSVIGLFILTPVGWLAYRAARGLLSKKSRQCGTFSIGDARDRCMQKYKIDEVELNLKYAKKGLAACKEAADPKACTQKTNNSIMKLEQQIERMKQGYNRKWASV